MPILSCSPGSNLSPDQAKAKEVGTRQHRKKKCIILEICMTVECHQSTKRMKTTTSILPVRPPVYSLAFVTVLTGELLRIDHSNRGDTSHSQPNLKGKGKERENTVGVSTRLVFWPENVIFVSEFIRRIIFPDPSAHLTLTTSLWTLCHPQQNLWPVPRPGTALPCPQYLTRLVVGMVSISSHQSRKVQVV